MYWQILSVLSAGNPTCQNMEHLLDGGNQPCIKLFGSGGTSALGPSTTCSYQIPGQGDSRSETTPAPGGPPPACRVCMGCPNLPGCSTSMGFRLLDVPLARSWAGFTDHFKAGQKFHKTEIPVIAELYGCCPSMASCWAAGASLCCHSQGHLAPEELGWVLSFMVRPFGW